MTNCQKLPPCPEDPVSVSSRMDLLLAKTGPITNDSNTSVITDLRTREKKLLCSNVAREEQGERNSTADTMVRGEGGSGGVPDT